MSNEQMAQSILQFTGGKGNIRIVSNCMTRVRLEVNDLSVVQIDQIKALKGVFGVHVDAQVQVIVGPGTAAKVAACLQELLGDAHKAAGQADKETAQEIAARNKQVIKSRQKVSKGKLFLKTISNVFLRFCDLVYTPEVKRTLHVLEVLQNFSEIQDLNYRQFLSFCEQFAHEYDANALERVIQKMRYQKRTLSFLRSILNYYGVQNDLSKYLSTLSAYKHPSMEEIYEAAYAS